MPSDRLERWTARVLAEHAGGDRGTGDAEAAVVGPAADLYLLLWNRLPDGGSVTVSGDPELLHSWQAQVKVRWA